MISNYFIALLLYYSIFVMWNKFEIILMQVSNRKYFKTKRDDVYHEIRLISK